MQTTKQLNRLYLWAALALLFTLITIFSFAQNKEKDPVKVKIVKIVDGDTTIIEKTMDESSVQDFTQQFQNIKGKNMQVMVTVEGDEKGKKNKNKSASPKGLSRTASVMHFNFDMDSATANAFGRCFMFSDSTMCKKFVWHDSLMKGLPKDFNFNFNFDDEEIMKDFDFDFNIDTEDDGKTAPIAIGVKKHGGNTIIINGEEDNVFISESDSENGKTKTQTKTIVINDDKAKTKKKVIVTTSVVVIDLEDEKEEESDKKSAKERDGGKSKECEDRESRFNFYPNPSDGNFVLDLDLNGKDDATVRITDMNGKEVYSEKFSGNGKTSKTINLGSDKNGTFIVTIKQGKRTSNKKIIIE